MTFFGRHAARLLVAIALCTALAAREPERARHAMVVTQEPNATDVGLSVLKSGGNAVDAAVAVAFALAVTHPVAGNIGGGGFLLLRQANGHATFIDFREQAPSAATRDMYLDEKGNVTRDSLLGWRAAGVPGTVRGLELAQRKYGSKPWEQLLAPAIRLASKGFPISYHQAQSFRESAKELSKFPDSKRIFLHDGDYLDLGEVLRQPDLASTLRRIAKTRGRDFYEGKTAKRIATEMKAHGGLITLEDLKAYQAVERAPLEGRYKGYGVLTAPLPSAGGIGLLQMLGMLEGSGYEKGGWGAASTIHYVAETMRRFYADRSEFLGDPDFSKIPVKGLLDPRYIAQRRASIDPLHATPSDTLRPGSPQGYESAQTTHFSIVDAAGNAVAMTYTINESYGSSVTVPGLGFLLNDEMDDFTSKPGVANLYGLIQGEPNAIAPRKRPLSAMTPTIVTKEGMPFLVMGAPGGSRITTGVLQVMLNVIDFKMNAQQAVDAPRFHHQWLPDALRLEDGFSPDTIALLEARGHKVERIQNVAQVEAILRGASYWQGAYDGRGNGKAAGY